MSEDNKKLELTVAAPGEWILQRVFGPTLDVIGQDLSELYARGRNRIINASYKRIEDINDGKRANLRVTRDVLWNGAFTDSEICAEYFGGIMAASRSEDGKDDSAIQFVEVTKSLSSKQLHLHYVIYNSLNKLWVSSGTRVNVALGADLEKHSVFFSPIELAGRLDLNIDTDFNILYRHGLLSNYKINTQTVDQKALHYAFATPTTFGVLLYASAHNHMDEWVSFDKVDFGDFDGIELPRYYHDSLPALGEHSSLATTSGVEQAEAAENITVKPDVQKP